MSETIAFPPFPGPRQYPFYTELKAWSVAIEAGVLSAHSTPGMSPLLERLGLLTRDLAPGLVALGDSITIGTTLPTGRGVSDAWPTYACVATRQRLWHKFNAGVGGNTTAMMIARFATDVTAHSPKIVSIVGGSNDLGQSVPLETIKANLMDLVGLVRGIGATPVLGTVPPRVGLESQIRQLNQWIRTYATSDDIALVDFYKVLCDGADGWNPLLHSGDGTHPSPEGYRIMGLEFARLFDARLKTPHDPGLVTPESVGENLLTNGLFAEGASPGFPSNWGTYGGNTGITRTIEPSEVGNKTVFTVTTTGANLGLVQSVGSGWAPGDKLRLACESVTPEDGFYGVSAAFSGGSGGTFQPARNITRASAGIYLLDFEVPAGATGLQVIIFAAKPGRYETSRITLKKLA